MAESKQEVAFRYAVERVNANRKILSQSLLSAIIEKIPPQDSFHASKRGKRISRKNTYYNSRGSISTCFCYISVKSKFFEKRPQTTSEAIEVINFEF